MLVNSCWHTGGSNRTKAEHGMTSTGRSNKLQYDRTKRLVSIPDAQEVLGGIGHTTIYDLIKRHELVKVNIGRRGFITSESLGHTSIGSPALQCSPSAGPPKSCGLDDVKGPPRQADLFVTA